MHLAYRNRKQTLPVMPLNDPKLAPYYAKHNHSPTQQQPLARKKSIELILDKHISRHTQNTLVYKSFRKTQQRFSKGKAESGIVMAYGGERDDSRGEGRVINRNKSTQLGEKRQMSRKRSDLAQYAPSENKRKSRSIARLQKTVAATESRPTQPQTDWLCDKFIKRQVYSLEENSDFC